MSVPSPHFLLFSESHSRGERGPRGDWRFVLQAIDGSTKLEVEEAEPEIRGERLELLAVVRGLEALEQPSRVTLVTPSRYVSRGLAYGLPDWRENGWQWELHGAMVPVKNHDLWQRLDRALEFHRVECRAWRFDVAEAKNDVPSQTVGRDSQPVEAAGQAGKPVLRDASESEPASPDEREMTSRRSLHSLRGRARRGRLAIRRRLRGWIESARLRLGQCGTALLPSPWLD